MRQRNRNRLHGWLIPVDADVCDRPGRVFQCKPLSPNSITEETLVSTARIINPPTGEVFAASDERVNGHSIMVVNS
jgi:hypothetical protein